MARINNDVVRQRQETVSNGAVQLRGQIGGLRGAEQVWSAHVTNEQSVAGEQGNRLRSMGRIEKQVTHMFRGVSRREVGLDLQSTN